MRRMSLFYKLTFMIVGLASMCLFYGFFIEPKTLKTRHLTIETANNLEVPIRIALLSDIHIGGPHVPASRVKTIVERVNDLNPDIILMAGDFIHGHHSRSEEDAAFNRQIENGLHELSNLNSQMGTFASIGNHDVWYDVIFVKNKLREAGLTVLENTAVILSNNLCVVGLADHDTQREDPNAFKACVNGAAPIVIMHSPDSFLFLRSDTVLAVAGHTHGGQINIPLVGRRVTSTSSGRKYAYGLVDMNGIAAFVTAGIGTSILPARFRAPPEIVLIELSVGP